MGNFLTKKNENPIINFESVLLVACMRDPSMCIDFRILSQINDQVIILSSKPTSKLQVKILGSKPTSHYIT